MKFPADQIVGSRADEASNSNNIITYSNSSSFCHSNIATKIYSNHWDDISTKQPEQGM